MPAKIDRCVRKLMDKGKSKDSAFCHMYKRYYEKEKEEKEGLILLIAKRGKKMAGYTGTKKKKKKTKGVPGSGTRKGKATRTAHGKQGQADIGKALKKGFNKVGELVRKGGDWLEKGMKANHLRTLVLKAL